MAEMLNFNISERVEEGQLQAKQNMFCVKSLCSNARKYL